MHDECDSPERIERAMWRDLKVFRSYTLGIVSSGYDDRFVMSSGRTTIRYSGLDYVVGFAVGLSDAQAVAKAILTILGLPPTRENLDQAFEKFDAAPIDCAIPYEIYYTDRPWGAISSVRTTSERIEAGIAVATGKYDRLTDFGKSRIDAIVPDLAQEEWWAIYGGLRMVNEHHTHFGKPVVEIRGQEERCGANVVV